MIIALCLFGYFTGAAGTFYTCQFLRAQKKIWVHDSGAPFWTGAVSVLWPILVPAIFVIGACGKVVVALANILTELAKKHAVKPASAAPVLQEEKEPGYRNPPACNQCGRGKH